MRLDELVTAWAERTPDAEALVLDGDRRSYAMLASEIDAMARGLLSAGVTRGERVATLIGPHPDLVVGFLAAASIGAIWVGLNPRYRVGELQHVVCDAEPLVLMAAVEIGGRDYTADLQALTAACPALLRLVALGDADLPGAQRLADFLASGASVSDAELAAARNGVQPRDPALIVYTSGSTGAPKGALLHHDGLSTFSLMQNEIWPVRPQRIVNYFPINHVGSVVDVTLPTLAAGGAIIFLEQFDPGACLQLMVRENVTVWASVPSVFQMMLALPDFADHDLSSLQLILWEGAAMPEDLVPKLAALHPRLATNYGMTETTSAITALEPTDDLEVACASVGSAFPGVEIRLVDANGVDVVDGQVGEVWARSRYNMLGYWRRPDATREAFSEDGYFRTGDLAVRRPDGRYRIVGRLKEMYKSGGYNVYPREVEVVLETHPAVTQAAVVGAPDPVWQEVGVAFVTTRAPVSAAELIAWCRDRLANYKAPKRVSLETDLPLLPIGKVDKAALRRRAADEASA